MGQDAGVTSIARLSWISSTISNGSRLSRSILLQKVRIGRSRSRHTSKSLRVWLSTPLAPSITITAASTAVSVRYVSSEKSECPGVSTRLKRYRP